MNYAKVRQQAVWGPGGPVESLQATSTKRGNVQALGLLPKRVVVGTTSADALKWKRVRRDEHVTKKGDLQMGA